MERRRNVVKTIISQINHIKDNAQCQSLEYRKIDYLQDTLMNKMIELESDWRKNIKLLLQDFSLAVNDINRKKSED